jgi:type III secretion system TyeA family effector delivery regulator
MQDDFGSEGRLSKFNISPSRLMEELVAISADHWVSASRFANMPASYGVRDITLKVVFTKAIIHILKDMPTQIFESLEIRNNIISAAQEALEAFIVEEEEEGFDDIE